MMSFWVVPESCVRATPRRLGGGDVQRQQPRRRRVDRHRGVHLVERDAVEQRAACRRRGRPARRPCRPRRGRACDRSRSRSASADRRRSTGRSGRAPGSCDRARCFPWPTRSRNRCGSATALRACAAVVLRLRTVRPCRSSQSRRGLCCPQHAKMQKNRTSYVRIQRIRDLANCALRRKALRSRNQGYSNCGEGARRLRWRCGNDRPKVEGTELPVRAPMARWIAIEARVRGTKCHDHGERAL